jgi:hypothetical protein
MFLCQQCITDKLLPKDNSLPRTTKEAQTIIKDIGVYYDSIHACPKYCILYRDKYEGEKSVYNVKNIIFTMMSLEKNTK